MLVFNDESYIFDATQHKSTSVESFDPTIGVVKNIPIADAALVYDYLTSGDTHILVARNILHVSTMSHHLLCPFITGETRVVVNNVAKIHLGSPTMLHIPLKLNRVFSYFQVRKPILYEIRHCDKVFITPDPNNWDILILIIFLTMKIFLWTQMVIYWTVQVPLNMVLIYLLLCSVQTNLR